MCVCVWVSGGCVECVPQQGSDILYLYFKSTSQNPPTKKGGNESGWVRELVSIVQSAVCREVFLYYFVCVIVCVCVCECATVCEFKRP